MNSKTNNLLYSRLEEEQNYAKASLFGFTGQPIIGVDEVGRGCLAGPVVAAAALFQKPDNFPKNLVHSVKDSKTLSARIRKELYRHLSETCIFTTAQASVQEIDSLNILHASMLAMQRAVERLCQKTQLTQAFALIDGNRAPPLVIPHQSIIRGDQHCVSIAAASIFAKVQRDRLMQMHHQKYPEYRWNTNAGYGSRAHKSALNKHGISPLHRRSFKPVAEAISISSAENH